MSNHAGGFDYSHDGRQRRCDGCTRKYGWAQLKEVFDVPGGQWGFWLCPSCLDRLAHVYLVPPRPSWRDQENHLLNVVIRSLKRVK